ncbi:MAG: glycosyltransferase family 4 protein [Candidatus Paceibacterota bacterium]|jgi:glycosyltransferase involved in cell wall biosynthesis
MKNKKKVLHLITKSNFGGAQRYVFDLATSLPKEAYETTVAFGGHGILEEKLHTAGIRTITIQNLERNIGILKDISLVFSLRKLFKSEKPDIVHVNSSKIGGVGALAARWAGIPKIVFTAHGWAFNEPRGYFSQTAIKFLSWLTVLFSTDVIVLSQKEFDQASDWLCTQKKLRIIPTSVTATTFATQTESRNAVAPHIEPGKVWLGSIAELHRNKGLDILVDVFAEIAHTYPNTVLVLIGGGEEEENLKKKISEYGLQERVVLPGYILDAKKYLPAFDIFVLPSRKEGLPYVILEAGQAGVPIISTSVGGIPEIIEDMKSGILVRPQSVYELKKGLEYALTHSEEMKKYARTLQEKITQNYSLEKLLEKTEEVYRKK